MEVVNYINKCINEDRYQLLLKRSLLKKGYVDFVNKVENYYLNINVDRWIQKLYNYMNLTEHKTCKCCDNVPKFKTYKDGYNTYCSTKCMNNDQDHKDKISKTMIDKYGGHILSLPETREKIKNTNIKRYGVSSTNSLESVKDKIKNTIIDRYGVDNISKCDININKIKEKHMSKYGVPWPTMRKEIKDKIKNTNLNRYNTEYPTQNKEIKDKIKSTNIKKYGSASYLNSQKYKTSRIEILYNRKVNIIKKYLGDLVFVSYDEITNEIKYKCNICNDVYSIKFQTLYLRSLNDKTVCVGCSPLYNIDLSKPEKELREFIQENYNGKIITNDRNIISPYELDIYLPDLNLAIEFNGIYWHSEIFKPKGYHKLKNTLCKNNGIQLIHIWEDDWLYKQDIIKSIILNKLNKSKKIYARKCIIKEVNNKEHRKFLTENHLQGFIGAKYKYGLYFNNELVSLMTFGKNRFSKSDDIELLRFCNKLNTTVVGGASKLFKHFIKINDKNIISYCNLDHGNGKLYEKLGFKYIKQTVSNYWWIVDGIRTHRFKWRKSELMKKKLLIDGETENDCMYRLGYYKIYDSGSMVFKFENT